MGDLLAEPAALGVLPPRPDADWPLPVRPERLRAVPGRVSERRFRPAAEDHWYLTEDVWTSAGLPPGPGPLSRLTESAGWDRGLVG
ncbi:hypothetical protein [Streptomyces sp. NPDC002588]|uniref:hypothetical protein n=1 Tax=Streptomyces sp. NPDC002588 TaxID=3154419 RepID=UPI003318DFA4